ncbi:MAG: glycosyltransferase [Pseudomonadota bacterium]
MRRVLVVSPNFPPNDTVDMHRVRMTVGRYAEHGWRPTVLRVAPGDTGRAIDEDLAATLPGGLEVVEVAAPRGRLAGLFGLNATGIRAWTALHRAGRRLLAEGRFDLVFVSTTEFPVMALGRAWKARFGVPYLLDFQDPWATFPASAAPYLRRGAKHRLMRAVHRRLEAWTLPRAGGLMAVSQGYVDLLQAAYPALADRPSAVSPFPYSEADFAVAAERGRAVDGLRRDDGGATCLFAGRIAPAMESSLASLFQAAAAGRRRRPEVFDRLWFVFVGTGYAPSGNPSVAMRLAAAAGMTDRVVEHPDRIRFLDAQKSMLDADMLLLLGSNDDGYIPSKLNQSLSLPKPLLCAAPRTSRAFRAVEGLATVLTFAAGEPAGEAQLEALADRLRALASGGPADAYAERKPRTAPFEAAQAAARDCALFDSVVETALDSGKRSVRHGR